MISLSLIEFSAYTADEITAAYDEGQAAIADYYTAVAALAERSGYMAVTTPIDIVCWHEDNPELTALLCSADQVPEYKMTYKGREPYGVATWRKNTAKLRRLIARINAAAPIEEPPVAKTTKNTRRQPRPFYESPATVEVYRSACGLVTVERHAPRDFSLHVQGVPCGFYTSQHEAEVAGGRLLFEAAEQAMQDAADTADAAAAYAEVTGGAEGHVTQAMRDAAEQAGARFVASGVAAVMAAPAPYCHGCGDLARLTATHGLALCQGCADVVEAVDV